MKQFWTMFRYGDALSICSKHTSERAARKAAKVCEKIGGKKHRIILAEDVTTQEKDK
jgi:hypothetical protein